MKANVLTVDIGPEDLRAFSVVHAKGSGLIRGARRNGRLAAFGLGAFVAFPIAVSEHDYLLATLVFFFTTVVFMVLQRLLLDRSLRKASAQVLSEGSNKTILGLFKVVIDSEGISEENDFKRTLTKWAGVERVVETSAHYFVYIAAHMAHVIPKKCLSSRDIEDDLRKAFQEHGMTITCR